MFSQIPLQFITNQNVWCQIVNYFALVLARRQLDSVYQSLISKKLETKIFPPECVANVTAILCNNKNEHYNKGETTYKVQREVSINALGLTIVVTQAVYKYSKNATSLFS